MLAFENKLLQRRKQNVTAVCAIEHVVTICPVRYHANFVQDRQLSLNSPQRQLTLTRDLAHVHLALCMMKQRAQHLGSHNREKQI